MLLANVAAEDGQSADAQRQGEEGLTHGGVDGLPEDEVALGIVHQVVEVGHEVEGQALHTALQGEGTHGQQYHHRQQAEHHGLILIFSTPFCRPRETTSMLPTTTTKNSRYTTTQAAPPYWPVM